MLTFFRNFKHLKVAYLLNIIGLSVAFSAFIIIMAQVRHEFVFDKQTPDHERIFRVEIFCNLDLGALGNSGDVVPIFTRMWGDEIISSSPLVETGTVIFPFQKDHYITIESNGSEQGFRENLEVCSPSIVKTFNFEMIDGVAESFNNPDCVLIPESIALKLFGTATAVGKQIVSKEHIYDNENKVFTVGGVFKDFKNSQIKNSIYVQLENKIDANQFWQRFNYFLFLKLKAPGDGRKVGDDYYRKLADDFVANYLQNNMEDKNEIFGENAISLRLTRLDEIYFIENVKYDGSFQHGKLSTTLILLSIGILILILATINFTNFSMALVPFRIKAINTKKVLGSSDSTLMWGLIKDAIWTTLISALISVAIVSGVSKTPIADITSTPIGVLQNMGIIIGTIILAVLIGFFAGIYPAKYTTSYSPALVLKGTFGLSTKGLRLRKVLVAIQFVISLSLIALSLLIQKQNRYMLNGDIGFNPDGLVLAEVRSSMTNTEYRKIESRIKELPYVQDIGFSESILCSQDHFQRWNMISDGKENHATVIIVSWNFIKTVGIDLVEGEYPRDGMYEDSRAFLIPNQSAKETFGWTMDSKIDLSWQKDIGYKINCFTEDVKIFSLKKNPDPTVLIINGRGFKYAYIRVADGADEYRAIREIGDILNEIEPSFPIHVFSFNESLENRFKDDKSFQTAISAFGILAIIISIIGVFGLILFDTQQKRKEIAIRRIHGANEKKILLMFSKPYIVLLGICFAISIPIVLYIANIWLVNFANKVSIGPWIFLASLAITLTIALLTIVFQVLRAVRNNPVDSIKIE